MPRWLILGALMFVGCVRKPTPESSGASHWLLPCTADAECGAALACMCGQCSVVCDADPNLCALGECVADGCGGDAVCRALVVDDPMSDGRVAGPVIDADNPRGVWQFHRANIIDGNVLEVRADGTFVYTLTSCDAVECAWGRWTSTVDGLRLRPPAGEAGFRWPDEFALDTVTAVTLTPTAEGMIARVSAPDRDDFEQAWLHAGLAVDCVDLSTDLSDEPAQSQHCRSPAFPDL